MEFKGTKGEWVFCEKHGTILDEYRFGIAQIHGIINESEWTANAKLIASAPEMLEMLKLMIAEFDAEHASTYGFELCFNAKQLIKKATL
jgi:hypothetical protein